jgi:hypothetical protein
MKNNIIKIYIFTSFLFILYSCGFNKTSSIDSVVDEIITNPELKGKKIILSYSKGVSHNHPLMACWVEDTNGNYLQTIYVAKSIASGIFMHGAKKDGKWIPGQIYRPAALPYWGHQRGSINEKSLYLPSFQSPLPDAVTAATPKGNFKISSPFDNKNNLRFVKILFEINQSWDWNNYWSNDKFPEDEHYKTSSQPAIIYAAIIDLENLTKNYDLLPIGHSHYSGKDGKVYTDLSTITTALSISKSIKVKIEP